MCGNAAAKRGDPFVHGKMKKPACELNGDLAMHGTQVLHGMHGMVFWFGETWIKVNMGELEVDFFVPLGKETGLLFSARAKVRNAQMKVLVVP